MSSNNSEQAIKRTFTGSSGLLLLFMIFFGIYQSAASQSLKIFRDTNCLVSARPMVLLFGDKALVNCDTAYLINAKRYKLYEKARQYLIGLDPAKEKMTIEAYEEELQETNHYATSILQKYTQLSEEIKDIQTSNQMIVQGMKHDLEKARAQVQQSANELDTLKDQLNASRRKSRLDRWMAGGVGLTAGLLLGILFIY